MTTIGKQERAASSGRAAHRVALVEERFVLKVVLWTMGFSLAAWLALVAAPVRFYGRSLENGPVESVGTLAFLAAAVVFLALARRLFTSPSAPARRLRIAWSIAIGIVFLLAFLEEISWGQQLFDWSTPESFSANVQSETNLHNFSRFDCHLGCSGFLILRDANGRIVIDLQRGFTLGVLGLAAFVPILAAYWGRFASWIRRLGLPVASMWVGAWVIANFFLSRVALVAISDFRGDIAARELMETMWGVGALLVAVACWPSVETFYDRLEAPLSPPRDVPI